MRFWSNTAFSRRRRVAICVLALLFSAMLFRAQIADALVLRGDELLANGLPGKAQTYYYRAITLDSDSELGTDRYVFILMQRHSRSALAMAIAIAGEYLRRHPSDATVLGDRALCYLTARQYAAASRDFERAHRLSPGEWQYRMASGQLARLQRRHT